MFLINCLECVLKITEPLSTKYQVCEEQQCNRRRFRVHHTGRHPFFPSLVRRVHTLVWRSNRSGQINKYFERAKLRIIVAYLVLYLPRGCWIHLLIRCWTLRQGFWQNRSLWTHLMSDDERVLMDWCEFLIKSAWDLEKMENFPPFDISCRCRRKSLQNCQEWDEDVIRDFNLYD